MVPDGIALCQFLYYAAVYYRYLPGRNYFTVVRNVENIMGKAEILVQNMSGQTLIWQTLLNTAKQHITSPLLTTGIYFVTIFNGKDSFTEKIMMH